jgi:hypothetical protein
MARSAATKQSTIFIFSFLPLIIFPFLEKEIEERRPCVTHDLVFDSHVVSPHPVKRKLCPKPLKTPADFTRRAALRRGFRIPAGL